MTQHDHRSNPADPDARRVAPLSDLDDWELKDGEPDVRGWEVVSDTGARIGRVNELLADTSARRVRYLDVEVDDAAPDRERHMALPIGTARLDEGNERVQVGATPTVLGDLPRYAGGAPDRAYEERVASCYGCEAAALERYDHPVYDDQAFYPR